mgnify:CR=1 FL=1
MKKILYFLIFCVIIDILVGFVYFFAWISPQIKIYKSNDISMYDVNDNLVFTNHYDYLGEYVELEKMSVYLPLAFISSEDENFYEHYGFDLKGFLRAIYNNTFKGTTQGGSTISQQLARSLFLNNDKSLTRKIKEAFLAMRLEMSYEKDFILEQYLNNIYLGHNLYGVSVASSYYFNKNCKDLTLDEAALLAVRRNKTKITMSEIDEATDRVLMGPAKTSHKYSESDRKLVAYHEAGHAVVGLKLANANDVQKVTIIPRGSAGGYNMMVPSVEKLCSTKTDLLEEITGLLGGRTAEEVVFGEITTGAHNDFEKATKIARAMVTEYGMSDLGPLQFEQQEGSVFLGRDYNKMQHFSNEVANEIDMEMRKIIDDCHKKATEIIKQNKDLLKLIAEALLEYETLTKEQIDYLVANGKMPEENEETSYEAMSITKLREIAKEKGIKNYSKLSKAELLKELDS